MIKLPLNLELFFINNSILSPTTNIILLENKSYGLLCNFILAGGSATIALAR